MEDESDTSMMEHHIAMQQRRAKGNDMVQNNSRNRNSFSGSNSNKDMEVYVTKMEQNSDRYQNNNATDESSERTIVVAITIVGRSSECG